MIDFVFTIDYELYGNGSGALEDLVFEPTRLLKELFEKRNARFVNFVEVAEFEKISQFGTDRAIKKVEQQILDCYRDGFEVALHLHPQWANARYDSGHWKLDLSEYNLCKLSRARIEKIVDNSLAYLRHVVNDSRFTPLSFRAGNWLFQPTATAATVLGEKGIRIDSSVFKGGHQRNHNLDYRPAASNGYYWPFSSDVNQADANGSWIEIPIHTKLVPLWKMRTEKRMKFTNQFGVAANQGMKQRMGRALDFMRFMYPLKLDFCRMTLTELTSMMEEVVDCDRSDPETYRPVVAIGHSKDLIDFETIDSFLSFLEAKQIPICTFAEIYSKVKQSSVASEHALYQEVN